MESVVEGRNVTHSNSDILERIENQNPFKNLTPWTPVVFGYKYAQNLIYIPLMLRKN